MTGFNQIERGRRTAIYIRISTSQQQTDRQETELKEFALRNGLNFNELQFNGCSDRESAPITRIATIKASNVAKYREMLNFATK